MDQQLKGFEAVLIFRMILFAMLLDTAMDICDILAMEERERYVYGLRDHFYKVALICDVYLKLVTSWWPASMSLGCRAPER